jgi:mannose-6-phosphate isomerase-like protein (cupin superfamily)
VRVSAEGSQPPVAGSELAVETRTLASGESFELEAGEEDAIMFAVPAAGGGEGLATLVLAGEGGGLKARGETTLLCATIGPGVDRHAPMGERERQVETGRASEGATGKRSFEILFGPHNGSTRATLFVGHVPPGAAPWHFHLYDEIVWIWRGEGRFHTAAGTEPLGPRSAFRISPREVHVVENTSATEELVVVGLFTPAGSPSAAYLAGAGDVPYPIGAAS